MNLVKCSCLRKIKENEKIDWYEPKMSIFRDFLKDAEMLKESQMDPQQQQSQMDHLLYESQMDPQLLIQSLTAFPTQGLP